MKPRQLRIEELLKKRLKREKDSLRLRPDLMEWARNLDLNVNEIIETVLEDLKEQADSSTKKTG